VNLNDLRTPVKTVLGLFEPLGRDGVQNTDPFFFSKRHGSGVFFSSAQSSVFFSTCLEETMDFFFFLLPLIP